MRIFVSTNSITCQGNEINGSIEMKDRAAGDIRDVAEMDGDDIAAVLEALHQVGGVGVEVVALVAVLEHDVDAALLDLEQRVAEVVEEFFEEEEGKFEVQLAVEDEEEEE